MSQLIQNPSLEYLREKQLHAKKVNRPLEEYLFVCPIAFGSQTHGGQQLLAHTRRIIEEEEESDGTALVGIAKTKQFEDLITSCRSAYAVEDKLDKDRTVFPDSFDALRLNLSYYKFDK